jgi:hypothetical protein
MISIINCSYLTISISTTATWSSPSLQLLASIMCSSSWSAFNVMLNLANCFVECLGVFEGQSGVQSDCKCCIAASVAMLSCGLHKYEGFKHIKTPVDVGGGVGKLWGFWFPLIPNAWHQLRSTSRCCWCPQHPWHVLCTPTTPPVKP